MSTIIEKWTIHRVKKVLFEKQWTFRRFEFLKILLSLCASFNGLLITSIIIRLGWNILKVILNFVFIHWLRNISIEMKHIDYNLCSSLGSLLVWSLSMSTSDKPTPFMNNLDLCFSLQICISCLSWDKLLAALNASGRRFHHFNICSKTISLQ